MSIDNLIEKEPSLEFVIPVLKWLKESRVCNIGVKEKLTQNDRAAYFAFMDMLVMLLMLLLLLMLLNDADSAEKWVSKCL